MTSTKKSSPSRRWITFVILMIMFTLSCAVVPYILSTSARGAVIKIPRHAKLENVRDSLSKYFGDKYAKRTIGVFNILCKEPSARYGAYEIPEGESPVKAARILARAGQKPVKLTINGVRNLSSFCDRIAAKFDFPADSLRSLLSNTQTLKSYGLTPEQAPALFLNDTYLLYWTSSPSDVIKKLGDNYLKFWNEENRQKAASLGLTPAEIMIIASITDEETNRVSEKGRIGRLYINRLHKGMRLQSDPTVRFALNDFTIKRISGNLLNAPGPYNTYRVKGLPPGPIRTTSEETINEILNSSPSDDLYMCAKEDFSGFHNFTSDYEQHLQNARRYQEALNMRGIF